MKTILLILLSFQVFSIFSQTSEQLILGSNTAGATVTGSWTVPPGVTSVTVEVWGGGGGAGRSGSNSNTGGAGGGGAYARKTFSGLTGGSTIIYYSIGGMGTNSTSNGVTGGSGGDTWANLSNSVPTNNNGALAKGGSGGLGGSPYTGGAGGNKTNGFGDVTFSGGSGQTNSTASPGTAGGSGAWATQDGNPGVNGTGGQGSGWAGPGNNGSFTAATANAVFGGGSNGRYGRTTGVNGGRGGMRITFNFPTSSPSLPWSENFDALTLVGGIYLPDGWSTSASGRIQCSSFNNSNTASNAYNNPRSGSNYQTTFYPTGSESFLWTPGFSLLAGQTYTFSFYWAGDGYNTWNGKLYTNTTASSTGATLQQTFLSSATTTTSAYTLVTQDFTPSSSGTYYFGIGAVVSSTAPFFLGFDDFSLCNSQTYQSSNVTQSNTNSTSRNLTNQEIISIPITMSGCRANLSATSFNFNTNGTTSTSDITNAKLWYTGNSSTFATTTQVGSTFNNPSGNFTISGNQQLLDGVNYFWLTYDIASNAVFNNYVDAECTSIIIGGNTQSPTTSSPAGNRQIMATLYWAGAGSQLTGSTSSTNFNLASNWSTTGPTGAANFTSQDPGSDNILYVNCNTSATLLVSNNLTISGLEINNTSGGNSILALDIQGNTLTNNGNFVQGLGTASTSSTQCLLRIGNDGRLIINGNASFGTSNSVNGYVAVQGSGGNTNTNGSIVIRGNLSFSNAWGSVSYGSTQIGTVFLDGATTQSISTPPNYSAGFQSGTLQIGLDNSPYVNLNGPNSLLLNSSNPTFRITNSSVFDSKTFVVSKNLTSPNTAQTGVFQIDNGATFKLNGSTGGQTGSNFPTNFNVFNFNSGSIFEYYASSQTVYGIPNYGNLNISTLGNKSVSSGLTLSGNLNVNSNATLALGTFTHSISGNLNLNGTITMGASTGILNLTGNCTINNSGTFTSGTTSQINIGGNWTNNNGTFNQSTSTVNFNNTTLNQEINGSATSQTFNNINVNKTGRTLSVEGSTTSVSAANLTITAGTLTAPTTLILTENFANSGSFSHNIGTVVFDGTSTLSGSSTTTFNNLTINSSKILTGHATQMNVAGNFTVNGTGTFTHNSGTVNFTGSGTQVVTNGTQEFNNVTIDGFGTVQLTGNTTINGNFMNNAGTLNMGNHNLTIGGNYANYSGLQTGSGSVIFNRASGTQTVEQLAVDFGNIQHTGLGTLQLASDISLTGNITNSAGTISAGAFGITLQGDWTNSGTGVFNPGTGFVAFAKGSGTQTINNGTSTFNRIQQVGGATVTFATTPEIKENIDVNGPIAANSHFKLTGSGNQIISGSVAQIAIQNFTVNKASGTVTISKPVRVSGTLTMTQGDIITDATNILEVGTSAASVGSVSWTAGTVRGPMKRWFGTTANSTPESGIFPIGVKTGPKAGTNRYAQVNFTQTTPGGYIIAEYKNGTPSPLPAGLPLNYSSGSYPQAIQNFEEEGYWDITPYSSSNAPYEALDDKAYTLTLRMNNPSTLTNGWSPNIDGNDLYNPSTIRLIRSKGSASGTHGNWELAGSHVSATGNSATGDYYITSNNITGFSWFNGGGNNQNPLPVELVSFTGACDNGVISLSWQTASEFNSSHFDVEKSRDGENWQVLTTLPSAGTSNELITYQSTDQNGAEGNNYFRLRQVDNDGTEKLYDPINVSCSEVTTGYFSSFPNPSGSAFQLILNNKELVGSCTMIISDASGKVIEQHDVEVKDGINMFVVNQDLTPGIYFLNISNGAKSTPVLRHAIK